MKRLLFVFAALCAIVSCNEEVKESTQEIAIVAHRGYWQYPVQEDDSKTVFLPHNSKAALQKAYEFGVWGSEFDVQMSSDSVLFVFHDNSLVLNGEKVKCEETPWSELSKYVLSNGEKLSTIDEFLSFAKQFEGLTLVYELKNRTTDDLDKVAVDLSVEALKKHELLDPSKLVFISFSHNQCVEFHKAAPEIMVQYLSTDVPIAQLQSDGIKAIDTYHKFLTERDTTGYLSAAKAAGFTVNTWTLNTSEDMKKVIDLGVNQITTDQPDTLRTLLKELNIKEINAAR